MKFNSVQLRQAEITAEITELRKDEANHPNTGKTESGKNDDYRDYPIYFLTANFKLGIGDCIILLQFHWHITYAKNWFLFLKIVT